MSTPAPDDENNFKTYHDLDRLCSEFEQSLKTGSYQNLEDWLRRVPVGQRDEFSKRLASAYRNYLGYDPTPTSGGDGIVTSGPNTVSIEPQEAEDFRTEDVPAKSEKARELGPYKLLQKIGEGGMGEVWAADQTYPVKRRVAVKLIKSGVDSRRIAARFEVERQALR